MVPIAESSTGLKPCRDITQPIIVSRAMLAVMKSKLKVMERWPSRLGSPSQRLLAIYVLGFQFFQAFSAVFAPFALVLALRHESPVWIALLATVPLALSGLSLILDVQLLGQFGRTFGQRVRWRDYAALIVGSYPYQIVLSFAGTWALLRHLLGRNNWVKTAHHGVHLATTPATSATTP